jgi:cytochrome c-type biogenesis protein CcmF|tara:strand:+ start:269 stop:2545 length:2277 start_codon:yes stop_codon:yes gene_type:complete
MIGDILLYISFILGIISLIFIFFKKDAKWIIRGFTSFLLLDFLLLTYYFVISNLTIDYVWSYTSKDLPLFYKLSGVLGGQQGTLLWWSFLISIGALWLNEIRINDRFIKKSQGVVIAIGLFFIALTILDSPFKTIYAANSFLSKDFLPIDGNGLNSLLIDPWMAVHPPLIFIGYASMTVPFSLALVYLFNSIKDPKSTVHRTWMSTVMIWTRISWLFLTLGIAIGGFWSYKVLGWGGFWAWDPVETSSFIPWLLLTGTLHALREHGNNKDRYNILTPTMVCLSFVLVLYATLVTRSGFFDSIHSFGAGEVGIYILILILICAITTIAFALIKYFKTEVKSENNGQILRRTNVFYLVILLFIVLTFISLWGITFPALFKLFTSNKVGVGIAFFNIWSYPVFLFIMLLAGLGLNLRASNIDFREFGFYTILTLISTLILPSSAWNIVDYSGIVTSEKPLLYSLIGSASSLSFIPPALYIFTSVYRRGVRKIISPGRTNLKIKEGGVAAIHVGVVLIILGSVFSTLFTQEYPISIATKGENYQIQGTDYNVKIVEFRYYSNFSKDSLITQGITLEEFYDEYTPGLNKTYMVRGIVKDRFDIGNIVLFRLSNKDKKLWVATDKVNIPNEIEVVVEGHIEENFTASSLNLTFNYIMFSGNIQQLNKIISTTQEVEIEVYSSNHLFGHGVAKVVKYPNSEVKRVMIDRGIYKDVYVIFTGLTGGEVPLTVKIIPMINFLWIGITFFALGMMAILLHDPRYGVFK